MTRIQFLAIITSIPFVGCLAAWANRDRREIVDGPLVVWVQGPFGADARAYFALLREDRSEFWDEAEEACAPGRRGYRYLTWNDGESTPMEMAEQHVPRCASGFSSLEIKPGMRIPVYREDKAS